MTKTYDVIIIGSGAGGATLAQRLAPTGKSILILERGEHLPREADNWNPKAVFIDNKYRAKEIWYDSNNKPFHPNTHYYAGGNTTFYGAALMRLREGDFKATQHKGGVSQAWPIDYSDLKPYYAEAERLWKVRGQRGVDPAEAAGDPDYAYPAIRNDPGIEQLKGHFESQGWKPFSLPLGVDFVPDQPLTTPCIKCPTCGGYPCLLKAKSDARTRALEPTRAFPNVTLMTGKKAARLETDASGRTVTAVVTESEAGEERWVGDIIVSAAGAVNTAALFLASTSGAHPSGLANSSDQVGRNYAFHTLTAVVSLTLDPLDAPFPKTLAVNDFYWKDPRGGFDFPMGHIQLLEYMSAQTLEGQVSQYLPPFLAPGFAFDAVAQRLLSFLVISEDLADPNNRVRLRPDGAIAIDYTHNNLEGHDRLVATLCKALDGFVSHAHPIGQHRLEFSSLLPLYGTAHQAGTVRFGQDPASSVLDPWCKAHDLDNLYVVDSGFFVTSAAVNPTLTIVANAMRVGDHLKERLGA
jgi:choline dehydrogenase-like flavoprotein